MEAVLTGHIGRKASAVLKSAGIRIYLNVSGRVGQAVESFKAGRYEEG